MDDAYAEYIRKIVDKAPPLTAEQRHIIRSLLAPGVEKLAAERAEAGKKAAKKPGLNSREREKVARIFKKDPK